MAHVLSPAHFSLLGVHKYSSVDHVANSSLGRLPSSGSVISRHNLLKENAQVTDLSGRARNNFPSSPFLLAGRSRSVQSSAASISPPDSPAVDHTVKRINTELDDSVIEIHTKGEFEQALVDAKKKLVVVEYAASHSINSAKIYPTMVDLSRKAKDAVFLLIMGDHSDATAELCKDAGVTKVPHFAFYKDGEMVHEEEGIDAEQLMGDVLYYGDNDAPIHQLHSESDVEALLQEHASDHKLVVVDVSLKHCGPCVKVYPTVVKLSKKMTDQAVFARLFGDESEETEQVLKKLGVVEVPTFLFIRDGKLCGRYVGSGKGELIGEVLRYQGVRVTY